ncbi:MAG TPA: phosphoglycerate mutase [Methylosinus sp.]
MATPRLSREIAFVLSAKLAALVVLYFAFFDPSHRPQVSPGAVTQKLFGDGSSPR